VTRIIGNEQVRAVEVQDLDSGRRRLVPCDWVVFTGDWIPDLELARLRGIEMDVGHRGPVVDAALRTSADGIFAAGNLIHPVDTADVAALDGRHVAQHLAKHLQGASPRSQGLRITVREPFTWVSPSVISAMETVPPRSRVLLWATEFRARPTIEVRQGDSVICRRRIPWAVSPGRVFRLPWGMFASADPDGGDVVVALL
jgi:pyruvate/2-oxoglutarate dehydrogenase complex dihydrolipoamide dehydrogenase (E3) component